MAADFPRLVSLACHDLRTPLATVQGFAKTMLRIEGLDQEKQARYLGLIDAASDELTSLLELVSLAARIEGGRYEPVTREADSLELAPPGATGTGAPVTVDADAVPRALADLQRAVSRHGGVEAQTTVDGPRISIAPVAADVAPVVLGAELKDFGAAVAVQVLEALGARVAVEAETLVIELNVSARPTS